MRKVRSPKKGAAQNKHGKLRVGVSKELFTLHFDVIVTKGEKI